MLLVEIEKTNGKATIILRKVDIPATPNRGKVQFFLDLEGGGAFQIDPEPGYVPERRLALLTYPITGETCSPTASVEASGVIGSRTLA